MIRLCLGQNLTSPTETLKEIDLKTLIDLIINEESDLVIKTSQLRRVGGIDNKAYQNLKKTLPYITCGIFNPPYRRTDNFASINCFILDLDHLSDKETTPEALKNVLKNDPNIVMMFTSPGGDGLKILFSLKEPFTDHGKYSLFYKLFCSEFTRRHNLPHVVDKKTSDVCRATFLCHDAELYSNPLYLTIDPSAFIDFNSALQIEVVNDIPEAIETETTSESVDNNGDEKLSAEILEQIKLKLNPRYRKRTKAKDYYVPEKVNQLENEIRKRCSKADMVIESNSIQYGKQIQFTAGFLKAELNIFFGKNGFSVVKSTKTCCSDEFNDLVYNIVMELIEP